MRLIAELGDILEPVRDLYVSAILETMAVELRRGADVDAEPVDRDADGHIRREGALNLPSRHDLRVVRDGRTLMLKVAGETSLEFRTFSAPVSDCATIDVGPFCWGGLTVRVRQAAGQPNWTPLRHWFLEAFQARLGEESPDLLGVAHGLSGPFPDGDGWRFEVDLGSASVPGFIAMIEALGQTGCARIAVGACEA
jgi:hypothetical protein